MATVGVIGVGRIGTPLVGRLVAAGHQVSATDVRTGRRETVEQLGARWVSDTRALASTCEVLLTAVPGIAELRDLVTGSGALLHRAQPGAIWVDHTSASVELGRELAGYARDAGVRYLDAPLGGGVDAMHAGAVTLYVGGDPDALADAEPVLRCYARTVHHVGDAGSGYLVKLLVNLLWFGQALLTTEALLVAQRHGLDLPLLQRVLRGSAGEGAFTRDHLPALLRGDYLTDFGLDRCVEELDAIEQTAQRAGVPHPTTSSVASVHRLALREFGAVDGELMAAAWLERHAGSELRPRGHSSD